MSRRSGQGCDRNRIRQVRCTALASLVTDVPTSTPMATAKMVIPVSDQVLRAAGRAGGQAGHPAEAQGTGQQQPEGRAAT